MTTQESFTLRITEHIILAYYASSLKILKKYEISTSNDQRCGRTRVAKDQDPRGTFDPIVKYSHVGGLNRHGISTKV